MAKCGAGKSGKGCGKGSKGGKGRRSSGKGLKSNLKKVAKSSIGKQLGNIGKQEVLKLISKKIAGKGVRRQRSSRGKGFNPFKGLIRGVSTLATTGNPVRAGISGLTGTFI